MAQKIIKTEKAPAPIGPYNQAVMAGNMLFISGQIPLDPISGELKMASIEEETHVVMKNLEAILTEAGMSFNNIIKTSIFLTDMAFFPKVNEIYGSYFTAAYPARETIAVKGLPKNVNVEISMIAAQ